MSDQLALEFERQRPRLRAVAYRMLGSTAEADDAVQEAWLRLTRSDNAEVRNLAAWLTTVVGRVALDMLRARHSRRETPLGDAVAAWPEPVVSPADGMDPEQEALLADSVGIALMVVLEKRRRAPARGLTCSRNRARCSIRPLWVRLETVPAGSSVHFRYLGVERV